MPSKPKNKSAEVKRGVTASANMTMEPFKLNAAIRNLFVTPREFLEKVTRPNVQDFLANSDDARRAFNAITAVDALAAHIYFWCEGNCPSTVSGMKGDIEYRTELAKREPDFGWLRDLAKAHKHVKLVQGKPLIDGMSSMRPLGAFEQRSKITAKVNGAGAQPVDAIVKKSLDFLEAEMSRLRIP